jgi:hypothetical protein
VQHFTEWKDGLKKIASSRKTAGNDDEVIKEGPGDSRSLPRLRGKGSVYEFLAHAYLDKKDGRRHRRAEPLRPYRRPRSRTLKLLAKELTDAGKTKEAADILDRLNFIYPVDGELHQKLGALWLRSGQRRGRGARIPRRAGHISRSTRRAHYDLGARLITPPAINRSRPRTS